MERAGTRVYDFERRSKKEQVSHSGDVAWKILTRLDAIRASVHTHWTVPRTANPLFTGREDLLEELGAIISSTISTPPHQEQCRIVISGLGGQGKSEICLQLARHFRPK